MEEWFRNSIPGIIILGAIGSILAMLVLYLFRKILHFVSLFMKSILNKVFILGMENIIFKYFRLYLNFKGTLFQLKHRKKNLSIIILYKKYSSYRDVSYLLFIGFFLISYFLLLFYSTEYFKTTIALIALTIISFHDALVYTAMTRRIELEFLSEEEEFAKNTYSDKKTLTSELLLYSKKN